MRPEKDELHLWLFPNTEGEFRLWCWIWAGTTLVLCQTCSRSNVETQAAVLWWEFLASEADGSGAKISCGIYSSLFQFHRKTSVFWLCTRTIPRWHIRESISTHELQSVSSDECERCRRAPDPLSISSPAWVNSCHDEGPATPLHLPQQQEPFLGTAHICLNTVWAKLEPLLFFQTDEIPNIYTLK